MIERSRRITIIVVGWTTLASVLSPNVQARDLKDIKLNVLQQNVPAGGPCPVSVRQNDYCLKLDDPNDAVIEVPQESNKHKFIIATQPSGREFVFLDPPNAMKVEGSDIADCHRTYGGQNIQVVPGHDLDEFTHTKLVGENGKKILVKIENTRHQATHDCYKYTLSAQDDKGHVATIDPIYRNHP